MGSATPSGPSTSPGRRGPTSGYRKKAAPERFRSRHHDVAERRLQWRFYGVEGEDILQKRRGHGRNLVLELVPEEGEVLRREAQKAEKPSPFRREQIAIRGESELAEQPLRIEDVSVGALRPLFLVEPHENREIESTEKRGAGVDDLDSVLAAPDRERVLLDRAAELLSKIGEVPRRIGDLAGSRIEPFQDRIDGGLAHVGRSSRCPAARGRTFGGSVSGIRSSRGAARSRREGRERRSTLRWPRARGWPSPFGPALRCREGSAGAGAGSTS